MTETVGVPVSTHGGNDTGTPPPSWAVVGDLKQFAPAWVTALGELKEVSRSRTANAGTYSYSYAELGDVLSEARTVLAGHDLAVFQVAEVTDGEVSVSTSVMHTSGAFLMFAPFRLPAGNTAQNVGSSCTYARRYSLMSILGLATEDDDGKNAGTRSTPQTTLSAENVDRFLAAATDALLTAEEIGLVVFDATKGRTIDPANVYVSEVAALREALHRHSDEGVSQGSDGAGEQASPAPPDPGGVGSSDPTSPDIPLPFEDTPDE